MLLNLLRSWSWTLIWAREGEISSGLPTFSAPSDVLKCSLYISRLTLNLTKEYWIIKMLKNYLMLFSNTYPLLLLCTFLFGPCAVFGFPPPASENLPCTSVMVWKLPTSLCHLWRKLYSMALRQKCFARSWLIVRREDLKCTETSSLLYMMDAQTWGF